MTPNTPQEDVAQLANHLLISMVDDMNTYAAGTDKVMLNTRKLVAKCLEENPAVRTAIIDSPEGLKFFGEWLERTDRAGSADLAIRTGALLALNDHAHVTTNLAKHPSVKKFLKGLKDRVGDDDTGDTPLPLALFEHMYTDLQQLKRPMLDARLKGAAVMGYQGGCRSDEYSGALRGWEAGSHTRIYNNRVEVSYTDRKTSDTLETVTMSRNTEKSGFDAGQDILDIAQNWGFEIKDVKGSKATEFYQYVDFYVLRANLNGISDESFDAIVSGLHQAPNGNWLGLRTEPDGARIREELATMARARHDPDRAEADRFVNVAAGTKAEVEAIQAWWVQHGVSAKLLSPLPGPMLLTTARGSRGTLPLPMPVTAGTLSAELKSRMTSAFNEVDLTTNEELRDQLSALPSGLSGVPKWNTHSLRRGGTKLARELMVDSEAREEDINLHYGWFEEAMKGGKKRQMAYASTVPAKRRMRVTSLF